MSERDLPSRVMREQQQQQQGTPVDMESMSAHHSILQQPRIHSSKSVPSLNSDREHHAQIPMSNSVVGPGMLSPGVGNSIPNNTMMRSAGYPGHLGHQDPSSSSNLRYPPHNYPSMTMQPTSKTHHMGPTGPDVLRSRSIQSLATDPGLSRGDIGAKSTPSLHVQGGQGEDERYYQNVGFYPPPPPPPNNVNPANMPLRTYIPYSNSAGNLQPGTSPHLTPSGGSLTQQPPQFRQLPGAGGSYRGPPPNLNTQSSLGNLNWQQQQQRQQLGLNQQMGLHHRDLMRQEAKMLEMQDELRRREERAALMMTKAQQHQNRYTPRFTYTPTPPMQQQQQSHQLHPQQHRMSGPPTVPSKPNRPDSLLGLDSGGGPGRPPLPDEYKFSSGEPPRGAFTFNNGGINKQLGGNPWDTAEKEREAQRRKEMARFWRDQQIQDLESLPTRNASQVLVFA